MRKYLIIILISYVAGIIVSNYTNLANAIFYVSIFAILAVVLKLIFKVNAYIPVVFISVSVGVIAPLIIANIATAPYSEYLNTKTDVVVQVVSYPDDIGDIIRYDAKIVKDNKRVGGRIFLNVVNKFSGTVYSYGDTLLVKNAILVPFNDLKNPLNITRQGSYASILASDYNISNLPEFEINGLTKEILKFREDAVSACDKYLSEDVAGIVKAITLGDRTGISDKISNDFSMSALSHLLSISGFHLSVLASYIGYLFKGLKANIKRFIIPVVSILVCTFMIIVTGGQLSVVRASVMIIMSGLAGVFYREYDSITSLMCAGGLIILLNPFSIYDTGFLLSFFATLGIILFSKRSTDFLQSKIKNKYLSETIGISSSAQITVSPVLAIAFNKVQILAIAANIVVLPVFSLLFVFSFIFLLLAQIAPAFLPGVIGIVFLSSKFILIVAALFAKIPFSCIDVTGVYFIMDIIFGVVALISGWVLIKGKRKTDKIVSALLIIVMAFTSFFVDKGDASLSVTFLDVGQGDCALVQVDEKALLIDGGSTSYDDVGEYKIKPYLLSNGINKLDYAIVSHYHDDHYSGILYLLDNFNIEALVLTGASNSEDYEEKEKLEDAASRNDIPIYYFFDGDSLKLSDNTLITAYSPLRNINYSSNDESLVLKLENPEISFLFTGDIESSGENKLKSKNLKTDVLKVAHHGSSSSSTDSFLNNADPDYAVISCGKNNMYGHPHDEVVDKLNQRGIEIYRTDEDGDITFEVSKSGELNIIK